MLQEVHKMEKAKNTAMIVLGIVLMAAGVYFFKIPNGFATGGVSGIATVLAPCIPFMTPGMLITVINILLLAAGFLILGRGFGLRTAACSLGFSLTTWALEKLVPLNGPLTDQPILELVYAILLTAVGSAILFSHSASSGGTDIVALILKKYTSVDTGKALLISDFFIAVSTFFVFGVKSGLYSVLGLFAKAFLVDNVLESLNLCKYFTIVTEHPDPISDYIIHQLEHGVTVMDGVGVYSQRHKKVLLVVCRRIEAVRLRRKLRELDPGAFMMITNSSEIIGRGFREI